MQVLKSTPGVVVAVVVVAVVVVGVALSKSGRSSIRPFSAALQRGSKGSHDTGIEWEFIHFER